MARLDLAAVMDALVASVVDAGILDRAYGWPLPEVSPPCVVAGYPTSYSPGVTMDRGHDRATFPIWLVLGRIDERTTRDVFGSYLNGTADIVDALNNADVDHEWSCRVMAAEVQPWVPVPELTYLSIRFDVDVLT